MNGVEFWVSVAMIVWALSVAVLFLVGPKLLNKPRVPKGDGE